MWLEYIRSAEDKNKAFSTLWTLKESYMKMTGRGMDLPLDSFEVVPTADGFMLRESLERPCFFKTMEFDGYIFSVSNETDFAITQNDFLDIDIMSASEPAYLQD